MQVFLIIYISTFCSCSESNSPVPEEIPPFETDLCRNLYPPADSVIATHTDFTKTNYPARIKVFQADTVDEGDIVMLGNSLTEQGGNWNIRLGKTNVKNRGIAGDNTDGVRARLNEIICQKPSAVFLMIGTNDLFISYSAEKVAQNIDSIGSKLANALPSTKIVVQTVMPLGIGNSKKTKLLNINNQLRSFESTAYTLMDTYQHMANEAGDLPEEYTYDGVHLTNQGYERWIALIKSNLQE